MNWHGYENFEALVIYSQTLHHYLIPYCANLNLLSLYEMKETNEQINKKVLNVIQLCGSRKTNIKEKIKDSYAKLALDHIMIRVDQNVKNNFVPSRVWLAASVS